jgi:4-hydroxybenzoate synthetase (chorismate lyase)
MQSAVKEKTGGEDMFNYQDTDSTSKKNGLEKTIINLLLNMDGSTTCLLENLIGGEVAVHVHMQGVYLKEGLPLEATRYFEKENSFLYRIVSLYYKGEPISDNIVIVPEHALDMKLRQEIEKGKVPLGKLINKIEHQRKIISKGFIHSSEVQILFGSFELNNSFFPVKKYRVIKDKENWFYICEVFHYKTICKHFDKQLVE